MLNVKSLTSVTLLTLMSSIAPSAFAQEAKYYLTGYAGYDDFSDLEVDSGPILGDIRLDRELSFGAAIGWRVTSPVRLELEFSARSSDADRFEALSLDTLSGGVDLQTLMVNALYDFSLAEDALVVPYIGAGVGLASVEFDRISSGFLNFTGDDDVLAYQGILGLAFPVTDRLDLSLDARYLRTDKVEFDIGPGALLQDEQPIKGLSVMAGLRWNF